MWERVGGERDTGQLRLQTTVEDKHVVLLANKVERGGQNVMGVVSSPVIS